MFTRLLRPQLSEFDRLSSVYNMFTHLLRRRPQLNQCTTLDKVSFPEYTAWNQNETTWLNNPFGTIKNVHMCVRTIC